MSQARPVAAPTTLDRSSKKRQSEARGIAHAFARWTNRLALVGTTAQFYTAGLAVFGAASFASHARTGWLVQVASLCTMIFLLVARVPFRLTRLAIVVLLLAILQPVLAFAPRASMPWLSALHPLNGLAMVAFALILELRIRKRAEQIGETLYQPGSQR
jgi:hypothetical protein